MSEADLRAVAASLDVQGVTVPATWREAGTGSLLQAESAVARLLVPVQPRRLPPARRAHRRSTLSPSTMQARAPGGFVSPRRSATRCAAARPRSSGRRGTQHDRALPAVDRRARVGGGRQGGQPAEHDALALRAPRYRRTTGRVAMTGSPGRTRAGGRSSVRGRWWRWVLRGRSGSRSCSAPRAWPRCRGRSPAPRRCVRWRRYPRSRPRWRRRRSRAIGCCSCGRRAGCLLTWPDGSRRCRASCVPPPSTAGCSR